MGGMSAAKARELRNQSTDAERRLWQKLKRRQIAGIKFRRQQPIGPYIVDFACLECRVVVEVDGGQHSERIQEDEQRSQWLEAQGFRVLRFWNNDVLANTEVVAQAVFDALATRGRPPTSILPRKGGGRIS
jgi:adenine-specific DNA-methyltransferase